MDTVAKRRPGEANMAYAGGRFPEAEALYLEPGTAAEDNAFILERLGSIALWNNRTEAAERYLGKALSAMPWYKKFWPFTAMLYYRLAMASYRRDRFDEAADRFLKAAGPIGFGPSAELKAMGRHARLLAGAATYVVEGPEESRVPFVMTDPLPVLRVSVNGREPVHFFIDTGGAEVILDREYAAKAGAVMAGAFNTAYAGNKKAKTGTGRIDSLQIGELTVRNVPVHTLDTASMSPIFGGLRIEGIIGTRLLMHFLATIDYTGGALVLRRPTPANLRAFEAQALASGARILPFWLIDTHYMMVTGTVNDHDPVLLFLDTGLAGSGFTAAAADLKAYGITVDWTKSAESIGGGGKTKGAGFTVDKISTGTGKDEVVGHNVAGTAIENSVPVLGNTLGFHVGGLISHQFFRPYALTMDFTGMRLFVS